MNSIRFLRIVVSIVVSILVLGGTLAFVGTRTEPVQLTNGTPLTATFTSKDSVASVPVPVGTKIDTVGELMLGAFATLRLDTGSSATLASAHFDEHTRAVDNVKILVKTGRVWLTNHVIGSQITLADEQVVARSDGGAILFDKTTDTTSTRIAAVTNPITLGFIQPGATTIFYEAVLPPNHSITLSADFAQTLFDAGNHLVRASAFTARLEDAATFADNFYADNTTLDAFTISRLTNDLTTTLAAYDTSLFDTLRGSLTFIPAAQERYWQSHAGVVIAAALADSASVDWEQTIRAVSPYSDARAMFAMLVPYTRLTVSGALSPKTKTALAALAALDVNLSRVATVGQLSPENDVIRELLFASAFTDDVTLRTSHLTAAKAHISDLSSEMVEITSALVAPLVARTNDPIAITIFTALTTTDVSMLANHIASEVALLDILIAAAQADAAQAVAAKVDTDLHAINALLVGESTAVFADRLPELTRRIAYLSTLHGVAPKFDETAYQKWLNNDSSAPTDVIESAEVSLTNDAVEPIDTGMKSAAPVVPAPEVLTTPSTDSTLRPVDTTGLRPNTSLSKVFDLLKVDVLVGSEK